jgi:hypothetical protein
MRSTAVRILCVLFGAIAVLLSYWAWTRADWRAFFGHLSLALLALVLWLAMPPGASRLQAPTVGTRGMRIALYAALLTTALVASSSWPAGFDDSRGSDSAALLLVAAVITAPFLRAERREKASP